MQFTFPAFHLQVISKANVNLYVYGINLREVPNKIVLMMDAHKQKDKTIYHAKSFFAILCILRGVAFLYFRKFVGLDKILWIMLLL